MSVRIHNLSERGSLNGEESNIKVRRVYKMREPTFHIYLDESEYSRVINSLVLLKNSLIQQGRYTDAVDDVLCKFLKAKQKKIKVQYI